jgi:hypothetical protein
MEALRSYNEETDYKSEEFVSLAQKLADLFIAEGYPLIPFNNSNVPYFRLLDSSTKALVINNLKFYLELCEEQVRENYSLNDSKTLLWKMIKKMKLVPSSDMLNHVKDGHVIEVYDRNNIQLFRNAEFLNICSYTIEDVYCRPWTDLYERDVFTIQQIGLAIGELFSGKQKGTFKPRIPTHSLIEKESAFQHRIVIDVDALSPLFDGNNNIVAFIVLESCTLTEKLEIDAFEKQHLLNESQIQ